MTVCLQVGVGEESGVDWLSLLKDHRTIFLIFPFCKYGTDPVSFLPPHKLINKGLHFFFLHLTGNSLISIIQGHNDIKHSLRRICNYRFSLHTPVSFLFYVTHKCSLKGANRDWHCLGCSSSFEGKQENTHFVMPRQGPTHSNLHPQPQSKSQQLWISMA